MMMMHPILQMINYNRRINFKVQIKKKIKKFNKEKTFKLFKNSKYNNLLTKLIFNKKI
jgi:hypothetical protein